MLLGASSSSMNQPTKKPYESEAHQVESFYSGWPKVCHNAMMMPESREAHRK